MARPAKSHTEKVIDRVGVRPVTATKLAQKMGFKTHNSVARALGEGVSRGALVKTERGYQKAK